MERILALFARPFDPAYPVVCFDERPCFLIGDLIEPFALQSGHLRKEHYAYEKHGSCALLAAIEPLTGQRLAQVHPQRTKKEFALFCQALAAAYPEAIKIRLVLDNLNTHTPAAFYETFPPAQARHLARMLEFHYTPEHSSWLNMAEVEISVLTEQCIGRRLGSRELLADEVAAWEIDRNDRQATIDWRFTIPNARDKLKRLYPIKETV